MTSFKKTRELLTGSYLADIISDEERERRITIKSLAPFLLKQS